MTDKDKIKEEIEKLHNLLPVMDGDNVSINYAETICTALEKYIDSFPEEPASEGLIEEIDKIWKTCNPIDEGMGVETANIHIEQFDDIARHFAEWQKKRDFPAKDITDSTMYWCGYKDCKEEIMKDAVEAEVIYPASSSTLQIRYKLPKNTKLKYGDKVKIIICKTEQQ